MAISVKHRSRIGRVLDFFRHGDKDEILAVFHMLVAEELIPKAPGKLTVERKRRRSRLNGADVISTSEGQSNTMEASA
jgi:hypothetical protein